MKDLSKQCFVETPRLILRAWQRTDLAAFAAINQEVRVNEYLLGALSVAESAARMQTFNQHIATYGFGLFVCVLKQTATLIGYVGLNIPIFKAHFTPCVEIGWRLGAEQWGRGYATEAARACLQPGFTKFNLTEIVAFTVPANLRSRRVMEKLGMQYRTADDFKHPAIAVEHPLSQHVLYRLRND